MLKNGKTILVICSFLAIIFTFIVCVSAISTKAVKGDGKITVVLDAGHGGIDGGVTGVKTGVKESELNLMVVKKLQEYFIASDINVVLTRNSDAGLYGTATSGRKKRDMEKRRSIIEESKPALVISVHMNKYSISTRRGGQVFYKKTDEIGKLLALSIQKRFNALENAVKEYQPLSGDYYILNCTDYPSVIAECGFLSNPQDESLLITEAFQSKVAYAIFTGAMEFMTEKSIIKIQD